MWKTYSTLLQNLLKNEKRIHLLVKQKNYHTTTIDRLQKLQDNLKLLVHFLYNLYYGKSYTFNIRSCSIFYSWGGLLKQVKVQVQCICWNI